MDTLNIFEKHKLYCGRMMSAHKVAPKGQVCVWNANVVTKSKGKEWYGDLNLTKDAPALNAVAKELGEPLYILKEHDCRFDSENDPIDVLISKATAVING